jgi:hypothetical protein
MHNVYLARKKMLTIHIVTTLVDEYKYAGAYKANFNASGVVSGVYFYQLSAGAFTETKKMLLLK